jgi:hypothetical protein
MMKFDGQSAWLSHLWSNTQCATVRVISCSIMVADSNVTESSYANSTRKMPDGTGHSHYVSALPSTVVSSYTKHACSPSNCSM